VVESWHSKIASFSNKQQIKSNDNVTIECYHSGILSCFKSSWVSAALLVGCFWKVHENSKLCSGKSWWRVVELVPLVAGFIAWLLNHN
jgi:hypothetical protein